MFQDDEDKKDDIFGDFTKTAASIRNQRGASEPNAFESFKVQQENESAAKKAKADEEARLEAAGQRKFQPAEGTTVDQKLADKRFQEIDGLLHRNDLTLETVVNKDPDQFGRIETDFKYAPKDGGVKQAVYYDPIEQDFFREVPRDFVGQLLYGNERRYFGVGVDQFLFDKADPTLIRSTTSSDPTLYAGGVTDIGPAVAEIVQEATEDKSDTPEMIARREAGEIVKPRVVLDSEEAYPEHAMWAEMQLQSIDEQINTIQKEALAIDKRPIKGTEKLKELTRLNEAKASLENSRSIYQRYLGTENVNRNLFGAGSLASQKDLEKRIPFFGAAIDLVEMNKTAQALEKAQAGEDLDSVEAAMVTAFIAQSYNSRIDYGLGGKVGAMMADMPTYAAEFAASGGIAGGGKALAEKGLTKLASAGVAKSFAGEVVGQTVGALARTATAFAPRVGASTQEYLLPTPELTVGADGDLTVELLDSQDSFESALAKAFGTTFVDIMSEDIGVFVEKPAALLKKAVLGKFAANTIAATGEGITKKAIADIAKRIGWNGIAGEVFEEEVSEIFQAKIEGREYKDLTTPEGRERFLVEVLGIGAFAGIGSIPSEVLTRAAQVGAKYRNAGVTTDLNPPVAENIGEWINNARELVVDQSIEARRQAEIDISAMKQMIERGEQITLQEVPDSIKALIVEGKGESLRDELGEELYTTIQSLGNQDASDGTVVTPKVQQDGTVTTEKTTAKTTELAQQKETSQETKPLSTEQLQIIEDNTKVLEQEGVLAREGQSTIENDVVVGSANIYNRTLENINQTFDNGTPQHTAAIQALANILPESDPVAKQMRSTLKSIYGVESKLSTQAAATPVSTAQTAATTERPTIQLKDLPKETRALYEQLTTETTKRKTEDIGNVLKELDVANEEDLPEWLPAKLRSLPLINRVVADFVNQKTPKGNTAAKELYDFIADRAVPDLTDLQSQIAQVKQEIKQAITQKQTTKTQSKKKTKRTSRKKKVLGKAKPPVDSAIHGTLGANFAIKRGPNTAGETNNIKPAGSVSEFTARINELNKFAQLQQVTRRTGGLGSTKRVGAFVRGENINPQGEVRLRESFIQNEQDYLSVLAHELGHAIEYNITGTTNENTMDIFGTNIDTTVRKTITDELKAITLELEGEATVNSDPKYYNSPTELLARFFEMWITNLDTVLDVAPTAHQAIIEQSVIHPVINDFMLAAQEALDKPSKIFGIDVTNKFILPDRRETLIQALGSKRLGESVYNDEVLYRVNIARSKSVIGKFIKEKFKNIKDDPATLFRAAESIKVTKDGIPEFGTRDFVETQSAAEATRLEEAGWEFVESKTTPEGEEYSIYARQRYTPEQGQAIFESLSPAGQELIKEFTSAREDVQSYFNRETLKEIHKINTNLEGWGGKRIYDQRSSLFKRGQKLKKDVAGTRQKRQAEITPQEFVEKGGIEDFQRAVYTAMIELNTEKFQNEFVEKVFPKVTKPIIGNTPDKGWVEVVGTLSKGVGRRRDVAKTKILKDGKIITPPEIRYQIPKSIEKTYRLFTEQAEEAGKTVKMLSLLSRYWKINVLTHVGTASTNAISGAIQYAAKIMDDFYLDLLTGDFGFQQTRKDIAAPVKVITPFTNMLRTRENLDGLLKLAAPKGWLDVPDWTYGADASNEYGAWLADKGATETVIDKFGDNALKLFGGVETMWKKTIAMAEGASELQHLDRITAKGLESLNKEEAKILAQLNDQVDRYAYDYNNVAAGLQGFEEGYYGLGTLIKPFMRYQYKYYKAILRRAQEITDSSLSWQDRTAKLLTLTTIVSSYILLKRKQEEERRVPEGDESTSAFISPRGRFFIGGDEEGNDLFIRTAKYPFFGLIDTIDEILQGNSSAAGDLVSDAVGTVGLGGEAFKLLTGLSNKYEMFTPIEARAGKTLKSLVPGFRMWEDIARAMDPFQRKPETFQEAFTSFVPTTDEDLQRKLHGKIRTVKVPIEGNIKKGEGESATRTTTDIQLRNYAPDILLSMFSGIYVTRINPDIAEAYKIREEKNKKKE